MRQDRRITGILVAEAFLWLTVLWPQQSVYEVHASSEVNLDGVTPT